MNEPPSMNARNMTDAEFDAAMKARAWRTPQPAPNAPSPRPASASTSSTTPPPTPLPSIPRAKHAREMSDAEFADALRNRAWRNASPSGI